MTIKSSSTRNSQIYRLILNENSDQTRSLFRLKKGCSIRFELDSLISSKKVRLFSNFPQDQNQLFQRQNYSELKWIYDKHGKYDDYDRYTIIECYRAGSFNYYFTIDGSSSIENKSSFGSFQVEAQMKFFNKQTKTFEMIEQESLTCQTVLSKCLGDFNRWPSTFEVTYRSGYSIIHLTPIQQLDQKSNSSYSIRNHHQLNSIFNTDFHQLKIFLEKIKEQWNLNTITDLVYNHVSNDCQLLKDHPESAYNLNNSPHLKSAALLDSIFIKFSQDISKGLLISRGIYANINEEHFQSIRDYFLGEILPRYRFNEYYICSTDDLVEQFRQQLTSREICPNERNQLNGNENQLKLEHGIYQRMKSRVNLDLAEKLFFYKRNEFDSIEHSINEACQSLRNHLNHLNFIVSQRVEQNLRQAIENSIESSRYHFIAQHGPKLQTISYPDKLFVGKYFYYPNDEDLDPDQLMILIETDEEFQRRTMAHNGWVINDDPLKSFADPEHEVYLRRELIQWSDLIKLRFGQNQDQCPKALYDYMKEYTRLIATTFDGCRLDNCHSTPIWFAQQMMDFAREINNDFYINAELFTGNFETDIHFINSIGINSLVRESHRAENAQHLIEICLSSNPSQSINSFLPLNIEMIEHRQPYSWLYDQTHDNPSQIKEKSVEYTLSVSSILSMIISTIGSNRGYDELVPHYIDVVKDNRLYLQWNIDDQQKIQLIQIRNSLNKIHRFLNEYGFNQISIEKLSSSIVVVKRFNRETLKTILLISNTSFNRPSKENQFHQEQIENIYLNDQFEEILLESSIKHFYDKEPIEFFQGSTQFIDGLKENEIYFKENLSIEQSRFIRLFKSSNSTNSEQILQLTNDFQPGSILILKLSKPDSIREYIENIKIKLNDKENEFSQLVEKLTLNDLNQILYRSSEEEKSDGKGFDVYHVPNYGPMIYAGLQGQINLIEEIRHKSDFDYHPLIVNIRQGDWLLDYIINRLKVHSNTRNLSDWFSSIFEYVRRLPRSMVVIYFELVLRRTYESLIKHSYSLMSSFIRESSSFLQNLCQTSVQLVGIVRDARLPILSSNIREPKAQEQIDEQTFERIQLMPSLAAGLPHFSSGIWRNWGRDTFISMRGLLILPGRFDEARHIILSYGQCLRHGLIPNLLADGKLARYNARDAVWWWIYSISNYTTMVPDGQEILTEKISRFYPTNDSPMQPVGLHEQMLYDIIQEVLLRHGQSLNYRERGAGHCLDSDMKDQGFNNQIGLDFKTGFIFGGNRWNCGTWMDKMGSSERAGNKGFPSTPRDGSPIELIGLSRSILNWLVQMNKLGFYPYDSIETASTTGGKIKFFFTDWINKIDENFEKSFWIDENDQSEFVNRRSIYKDTIHSSLIWSDYQLRPNFLIAAVVAPEMFDKDHIWKALEQVEKYLLGKYGMKTLDPSDYNYVADYDNDDDSDDFKRARGFNYHNGPEWLWLTGYYIRAKLYWSKQNNDSSSIKKTIKHLRSILSRLNHLLNSNIWKGLPELTNDNGNICRHSCSVQAWSSATLIEAIYDLTRS